MTNQRVSDAFTSNPFSIHVRHILHTSKFQHSYFTFFYQRVSIASYASAGIARGGMSVCPSVRHTPVLCQNEESHDFFTICEPEFSSFWKCPAHPEIR